LLPHERCASAMGPKMHREKELQGFELRDGLVRYFDDM
jgi:hypothetical protein